jgi:hypothetical protein
MTQADLKTRLTDFATKAKRHFDAGDKAGRAFYIAAGLALGKAKALEYKERGEPKKGKPSLWLPIAIKTTGRDERTIRRWVAEAADESKADARIQGDRDRRAKNSRSSLTVNNPVRGFVTVPEKTIPTPSGEVITFPSHKLSREKAEKVTLADDPVKLEGRRIDRERHFQGMIHQGFETARDLEGAIPHLMPGTNYAELANAAEQVSRSWLAVAQQLKAKANEKRVS